MGSVFNTFNLWYWQDIQVIAIRLLDLGLRICFFSNEHLQKPSKASLEIQKNVTLVSLLGDVIKMLLSKYIVCDVFCICL